FVIAAQKGLVAGAELGVGIRIAAGIGAGIVAQVERLAGHQVNAAGLAGADQGIGGFADRAVIEGRIEFLFAGQGLHALLGDDGGRGTILAGRDRILRQRLRLRRAAWLGCRLSFSPSTAFQLLEAEFAVLGQAV